MSKKTRPHVKIDQSIAEHPRIIQIKPALVLSAVGLHCCAIGWCDRMRTDGRIPATIVARYTAGMPKKKAAELVAEMTRVGLWIADSTCDYVIHDYLDWQDSAEQIAAKSAAARQSAVRRWGDASGNANRNAVGNATEPSHTEPIRTEGEKTRASALPPCLSEQVDGVSWASVDGGSHATAAQAFWSAVENARQGVVSTADHGLFASIVSETCPASCEATPERIDACLGVLEKAVAKTKGKPTALFRRICEEDR